MISGVWIFFGFDCVYMCVYCMYVNKFGYNSIQNCIIGMTVKKYNIAKAWNIYNIYPTLYRIQNKQQKVFFSLT